MNIKEYGIGSSLVAESRFSVGSAPFRMESRQAFVKSSRRKGTLRDDHFIVELFLGAVKLDLGLEIYTGPYDDDDDDGDSRAVDISAMTGMPSDDFRSHFDAHISLCSARTAAITMMRGVSDA